MMSCDDISRYSVSSQSGSKGSEAVSYYLDQDSGQFFSLLEGDGPPVPEYDRGRNTGVRRRDKTPTHGETGVVGALPFVRVNVATEEKHACLPPFYFLFFCCLPFLVHHSLHSSASFCFGTTCTLSSKRKKKKENSTSVPQTNSRQTLQRPLPCLSHHHLCVPCLRRLPGHSLSS